MDVDKTAAQCSLSRVDQRILLSLLVVASASLLAGWVLPLMTMTQLILFSHTFSVFTAVLELWEKGHVLLFLVVVIFSVVIPALKIITLFKLLVSQPTCLNATNKLLRLMHDYGRWAMLDVMVVAVLIVTVKLGAIASIEVHSGLYVFGFSVLLIMFVTHRVVKLMPDKHGG